MKKLILFLICIISLLLCSCASNNGNQFSNENSSNNNEQEGTVSSNFSPEAEMSSGNIDTKTDYSKNTEYHKLIYDGKYIAITLEAIYHNHINFSIESKMHNNKISIYLDSVALDGLVPPISYSDTAFPTIEPGDTVSADINAEINYTDHKYLSATFEVYNDEGTGVESINIVNYDLGLDEHIEYEEPEELLTYDSALVSIYYVGAEARGIRLRANNKLTTTLNFVYEVPFHINSNTIGDYGNVWSIPPCSTMDIYINVKDFDADYDPSSVKTFECQGKVYSDSNTEEFSISNDKEVIPYSQPTDKALDSSSASISNSIEKGENDQYTPLNSETSEEVNAEKMQNDDNDNEKTTAKEEESNTISLTEQSYNKACSLTVSNLKKEKNAMGNGYNYYIIGDEYISLLSEDVSWIEDSLNTEGTVNQGAIYRKLAKVMEGVKKGLADYKKLSPYITGFVPDTKDEFIEYTKDYNSFIVTENEFESVMKKFETLNSINGEFIYAYFDSGMLDPMSSSFKFEINNVTECAKELNISEEMLGYVLAMLEEYGPNTQFKGNTFTFSYGL